MLSEFGTDDVLQYWSSTKLYIVNRLQPVNGHGHKPIALRVLELHDLMPLTRQLPHLLGFEAFCSCSNE